MLSLQVGFILGAGIHEIVNKPAQFGDFLPQPLDLGQDPLPCISFIGLPLSAFGATLCLGPGSGW